MCIVCNCDGPKSSKGSDFLTAWEESRVAMEKAAAAMLACRDGITDFPSPAARTMLRNSYDAAHKKMVRLIREWNRIEQEREPEEQYGHNELKPEARP